MPLIKFLRLPAVVAAWLILFPAAFLLAVSVLRVLQPPQYEPAHTSTLIFEWTTTHISRSVAATLFLGMPLLTVCLGGAVLLHAWRADEALRRDATAALQMFRRNLPVGLLTAATLLGAAILVLVVTHLIAG